MTVCQGIEKMFALCHKLCDKKEESTVGRTFKKIYNTEINTLFLNVSNVLNHSILSKY